MGTETKVQRWLTLTEAARLLDAPVYRVKSLHKAGRIGSRAKIGTSKLEFNPDDVAALIEEQSLPPTRTRIEVMSAATERKAWLTLTATLARLGVGRRGLEKLVREGRLTVRKFPGLRAQYAADDVDRLVTRYTTPAKCD